MQQENQENFTWTQNRPAAKPPCRKSGRAVFMIFSVDQIPRTRMTPSIAAIFESAASVGSDGRSRMV